MDKNLIFQKLWNSYRNQNPSVQKVYDLFSEEGEKLQNDHVAFRTFNDPRLNIGVLARPFLEAGYVQKGEYSFPDKHLFARHYEHASDPNAPFVFISELILGAFSNKLQQAVQQTIDQVPAGILRSPDLIFAGNVFGTPSYPVYEMLRNESEYAAWVYVYGYRANHFTVSINALKKFRTLESVNDFLKKNGFKLNSAGGEIKGKPSDLLQQSSTLADIIPVEFVEGTYDIPACYYEFALRYPGPDGQLFSGFIAGSADKIFESTDYRKR